MTDAARPAPDGDGAPKRGAAYITAGAVTLALGIVLLFVDGLEVLSWMLIPGGALWVIIGLSQRNPDRRPRPAPRSRQAARRDDGGATPIIATDSGSGPARGAPGGDGGSGSDGGGSRGGFWGGFGDGGGDGGGGGGGD